MPLSSIIDDWYYNVGDQAGLSAQLNELLDGVPEATISAQLNELLDGIPQQTLSAQMNMNVPSLLILKGVNLTTGQIQNFEPGDFIVRTNGTLYLSATGIQGLTGAAGVTGLIGITGQTGIIGTTGLIGITGLVVPGITGSIGASGVRGFTGLQPVQGVSGLSATGIFGIIGLTVDGITGLKGLTGLSGVTGINLRGASGLQGTTGIIGLTGSHGITGIAPLGISPRGPTGIVDGVTGFQGITGISGNVGIQTLTTLNVQQQSSGTTLTYTVPANSLNVNEQQLEILAWGLSSTSGVPTTITITFGGATVLNTSEFAPAGANFYVKGLIIRTGAATQENTFFVIKNSGTGFSQRSSTSIDLTSNQDLVFTVSSTEGTYTAYALITRKVTEA